MKKITSMMLALVMVFAMMIPAFASDYSDKGTQSITAQGVTRIPTIAVIMPTIGTNPLVLNPYKLAFSVSLNGGTAISGGAVSSTQVIAPVYTITNGTGVPMTVDITATGTPGGNLQLATAALGDKVDTETKNSVYCGLYAATRSYYASENTRSVVPTQAALKADSNFVVAIKSGDATKKAALTTAAATVTYSDEGTATPEATGVNYIDFTFAGDAASNPTTAWSTKDTLKIAVAFTFNMKNSGYSAS